MYMIGTRYAHDIIDSMSKRLSCFTPEVMLATFIFESGLALYVFVRYRLTAIGRIALAMILSLAVFQLAEYGICTGSGSVMNWMRIGFIAITLLPPLGVHLVGTLKRRHTATYICYGITSAVVVWLILPGGAVSAVCTGNYVIFDLHPALTPLYLFYYFGLLGTALYGALQIAGRSKAARWFSVGYLSFIGPMGVVYLFDNATHQAVPSIMCGFAAVFAAILAFKVVPLSTERRTRAARSSE